MKDCDTEVKVEYFPTHFLRLVYPDTKARQKHAKNFFKATGQHPSLSQIQNPSIIGKLNLAVHEDDYIPWMIGIWHMQD